MREKKADQHRVLFSIASVFTEKFTPKLQLTHFSPRNWIIPRLVGYAGT